MEFTQITRKEFKAQMYLKLVSANVLKFKMQTIDQVIYINGDGVHYLVCENVESKLYTWFKQD